jgi:hypothetical protein
MKLEHCRPDVGSWEFTTTNYAVTTTPRKEWELVVSGTVKPDQESFRNGRQIPSIDNLQQLNLTTTAGLRREEVIAVVLYTGPLVLHTLLSKTSLSRILE